MPDFGINTAGVYLTAFCVIAYLAAAGFVLYTHYTKKGTNL